jgi:hypothetical protein
VGQDYRDAHTGARAGRGSCTAALAASDESRPARHKVHAVNPRPKAWTEACCTSFRGLISHLTCRRPPRQEGKAKDAEAKEAAHGAALRLQEELARQVAARAAAREREHLEDLEYASGEQVRVCVCGGGEHIHTQFYVRSGLLWAPGVSAWFLQAETYYARHTLDH